jgi:hypothetical protein
MKCVITCVTTFSVSMSDANVSLLIPEALSSYGNKDAVHEALDKLQVIVRYSI